MQTNTQSQSIAFTLFAAAFLLMIFGAGIFAFEIAAETAFADPLETRPRENATIHAITCPPKTTDKGNGLCVLTADTQIGSTFVLESGTTLDCQPDSTLPSAKLLPMTAGMGTTRSSPEVAIFIHEATNVTIKNCSIQNFDFGILAIKSKTPSGSHHIINNKINARYMAISLMSVDNTEIIGNDEVIFTTQGGRGISVTRDSDHNLVQNNHVFARLDPNVTGAFRAPGPESTFSNPVVLPGSGSAILIGQTDQSEPTLLNIIVNQTLYQMVTSDNATANIDFTADNTVERNIITFDWDGNQFPKLSYGGIALAVAQNTKVLGNTIMPNAGVAIRVGIQTGTNGMTKTFPGTCTSNDPNTLKPRSCLDSTDCLMSFDTKNIGPCTQSKDISGLKWISNGNEVGTNTINGPFDVGIATAGNNTTVRGNKIIGPVRPGTPPTGAIAAIGKLSLENAVITQNTVSGATPPLVLIKTFQNLAPTFFGAQISLNDFTGYSLVAVQTSDDYDVPSELSVNGHGNYWGACTNLIDSNRVQTSDGAILKVVSDRNPYENPVARVPKLAALCVFGAPSSGEQQRAGTSCRRLTSSPRSKKRRGTN